ncbi:MAG: hypothetical protein ACP5TL_03375 [Candidatus Micrarchaeia archaeon]
MAGEKRSKSPKRKPSKHASVDAIYVKLNSIVDFARLVSVSGSIKHIMAFKDSSMYKLFTFGERVEGTTILYYVEIEKLGKFFVYGQNATGEYVEIKDNISQSISDYSIIKAPILEIVTNPFSIKKKLSVNMPIVEIRDFDSFIKAAINESQYGSASTKAYAFFYNGKHYACSFELMRDGIKAFSYVKLDTENVFNYIKYDYNKDTIEHTPVATEKFYTYVRIINLAEPFPFFTKK